MRLLAIIFLIYGISKAITIDEAIKEALERNYEIVSFSYVLESYKGKSISAGAFPNPDITVESVTLNERGTYDKPLYLIEISQEIPLWGIRSKARSVVKKERESLELEYENLKRKVISDVYKKFYEALYRKENLSILRDNLNILDNLEKYVSEAYDYGEATDLEILRIKREKDLVGAKVKIAEALYSASLKDLSYVIGREVKSVEGNIEDILEINDFDIKTTPLIKAFDKKIEAVDEAVNLEKALSKPSISLGLVAEDSKAGYYEYRILVSGSIPIFYRRKGEILEKVSLKESLKREREGKILELSMSMESINLKYRILVNQLKYIEENTLPSAKRELEIAMEAYRNGVISLFEFSNIRESYYMLLKEKLDILRELHFVIADYLSLGGWQK